MGLQIEYNLVERTVERDLIPMGEADNLGVIAWSPLCNGVRQISRTVLLNPGA